VSRLLIIAGDGSEREVELAERTIQIGRGPGNDIVLSDPNSGVSRTHAELRFRNGRCVVVDLQSQNGTFVNGERIEHAEIPMDGEVSIGTYRLRLLSGSARRVVESLDGDAAPPSTVGFGRQVVVTPDSPLPEIPLERVATSAPPPGRRALSSGAAVAGAAVIVLAGALLVWVYTGGSRASDGESPSLAAPEAPVAAAAPDPVPVRELAPDPGPAPAAVPASPPALTGSGRTTASVPPVTVTRYDGSQITRRPGESTDAWRARAQAFQTRYAYSRAALDRGDFAAAAGGFQAILQEEPGYLDVPQLLVRARAGLRDVARDVYEAGLRLDAAGDWLGALQKFEQAGQIHPEVRGLPDAMKRVREKLRTAGEAAFGRARRFDESGRWADALKEYEKAVQWLPNDDPRWEMAQSRVEQLKRVVR
jgi:hypothetical protein